MILRRQRDGKVTQDKLEIASVRNALELNRANDLMAKVFARDYFDTMQWMGHVGNAYPGFRMEHTRLAQLGGDAAGALRVTTDTIRIGEARLYTGGYGWIATAPHHRHKGVARELISDTMQYMRERAFQTSMLFGIPNFYHRFGFHTTLAEYTTRVDVRDLPPYQGPAFRVREAKPGDVRMLQKMHEQNDTNTACSIIRCAAHFHYHWQRWESAHVVMSPEGKVLGYFVANRKSGLFAPRQGYRGFEVEEVGVLSRAACAAVLEAAVQHARGLMLTEIQFHAPPEHPLAEHLLQYRSIHTTEHTRGEGGMMAVVNMAETLEAMIPEWENQLQRAGHADLKSDLTLYVDGAVFLVRCHHGAISILRQAGANKLSLSAEEFIQLLTGYRPLAEVLAQERRIINADGLKLAHALFPKRHPYVWRLDRF